MNKKYKRNRGACYLAPAVKAQLATYCKKQGFGMKTWLSLLVQRELERLGVPYEPARKEKEEKEEKEEKGKAQPQNAWEAEPFWVRERRKNPRV